MTPEGWYLILALSLAMFGAIFAYRKGWKKHESMQLAIFIVLALCSALLVEFIGVTFDLWHYVEGDWPPVLWLAYIATGAAGFQLVSLVKEKVRA